MPSDRSCSSSLLIQAHCTRQPNISIINRNPPIILTWRLGREIQECFLCLIISITEHLKCLNEVNIQPSGSLNSVLDQHCFFYFCFSDQCLRIFTESYLPHIAFLFVLVSVFDQINVKEDLPRVLLVCRAQSSASLFADLVSLNN